VLFVGRDGEADKGLRLGAPPGASIPNI
jgi:hypothetical protein